MSDPSRRRKVGESYSACYRRVRQRTNFEMSLLQTEMLSGASATDSLANIPLNYESQASFNVRSSQDEIHLEEASDDVVDENSLIMEDAEEFDNTFNFCSEENWIPDSDTDTSSQEDDAMSSDDDDDNLLMEALHQWTLDHGISNAALRKLLQILKTRHPSLPLDPRTLLQTRRKYEIIHCGAGQYYHNGVERGLLLSLDAIDLSKISEVMLQINIDGLPLFKSSNVQFWPILCQVKNPLVTDPFVVGIYSGPSKPPVAFLNEFVAEMKQLLNTGLTVKCKHLHVKLHSFVCDAPARAFVKCIKSHSGYSCCEKCTQRGEWDGKVIFPDTAAPLRTDELFAASEDEDHHLPNIVSPLMDLQVGLVSLFPLDPMHLLYLGVMRRLLLLWIRGPVNVRLSAPMILNFSQVMLQFAPCIPREFARRPRSLSEIDRWKATEFRLFLLYLGPVVLQSFVREHIMQHFLLLFVASTILSRSDLCHQLCDYASSLLNLFVRGVEEIYSRNQMVYNIHGLLHLAADAKRFGTLDSFSSFPFENKLRSVKKLVRKPQLPLQQVVRRLSEYEKGNSSKEKLTSRPNLRYEHFSSPAPAGFNNAKQFTQLVTDTMFLSVGMRNGCVMLKDGSVVIIKNFLVTETDSFIVCNKFVERMDLFDYPLSSSNLDIYKVCGLEQLSKTVLMNGIVHKCMLLPIDERNPQPRYAVIPLLHT